MGMQVSPDSGRYDNLHGDEDYFEEKEPTFEEVIQCIVDESSIGSYSYIDWIKRATIDDSIINIMQHICKNIDKPEFKFFYDELKISIEAHL